MQLRPYQLRAIADLRGKIRAGVNALVLVSPTGSGKTVIASHIIDSSVALGRRVLFVAHRKELVDQASAKLSALQVPHGVLMSTYPADPTAPVQVASVQTAVRRDLPAGFDLVIIDECHHAAAESYSKIIATQPGATVLGLTATAFRADGRGLGDTFGGYVQVATVQELTDMGFLVPARYWAPSAADMRGVRKTAGDYDQAECAERSMKPKLIGDIVAHYRRVAPGERAICFAVNVAHSQAITTAFRAAGIAADHLDAETPRADRERILAGLAGGRLSVVCNCGILSEGYDNPAVSVCIQARPTMSLGLHLQQVGRVLRPHHGKQCAKILDHAGNVARHGFATDEHPVDLAEGVRKSRGAGSLAPSVTTCRKCYAVVVSGTEQCPCCGASLASDRPKVKTAAGDLEELKHGACQSCGAIETRTVEGVVYCNGCGVELRRLRRIEPEEYLRQQLRLCSERGWKPGRAFVLFKNRFGSWPTTAQREAAAA
jgi:DNA repair protein RadD